MISKEFQIRLVKSNCELGLALIEEMGCIDRIEDWANHVMEEAKGNRLEEIEARRVAEKILQIITAHRKGSIADEV